MYHALTALLQHICRCQQAFAQVSNSISAGEQHLLIKQALAFVFQLSQALISEESTLFHLLMQVILARTPGP